MKNCLPGTLVLLCLIGASPDASAANLRDQAVTYSDFSFVNYVATSLSYAYFASTGGITRYDKLHGTWADPLTSLEGVDWSDIHRIWVDHFDHSLYAETPDGLFEYDSLLGRWFTASELPDLINRGAHVSVPKVMFPPFRYNYSNDGRLIDAYGRHFTITDVVDDGSGQLWFGTWGHGAGTAGSSSKVIELLPFGLLQDRVDAITMLDGRLWVSGALDFSQRSGISVFDKNENTFRHIESGLDPDFPAVDVNCLFGNSEMVYIGTPVGLLVLDQQLDRVIRRFDERTGLPDDNVLSITEMGRFLYVGTANGLCLMTPDGDSISVVRPEQLTGRIIYDLEQDSSSIWIATDLGAYRMHLSSGRLQRFKDPWLYAAQNVYDVERCGHNLWLACEDAVLRVSTNTGDIDPIPLRSSHGQIRVLTANDTIVAMGADDGLTIVYHNDPRFNTRRFTTDDGLPSNLVLSLLMDGNYIWVGTEKGLTRFWWNHPRRID